MYIFIDLSVYGNGIFRVIRSVGTLYFYAAVTILPLMVKRTGAFKTPDAAQMQMASIFVVLKHFVC